MPLIDFRTNLKSLKYGYDRPDGGSSRQPYTTSDVNDTPLYDRLDDGFIRAGALEAARSSATDLKRITNFLVKDQPRGTLFIAKQIGLQLTNPRLEYKKPASGTGNFLLSLVDGTALANVTNGLLIPTRIYNLGVNTLAQVPVNAFGGHLNRHGVLPIQSDDTKYESVVLYNQAQDFLVPPPIATSTTLVRAVFPQNWKDIRNRLLKLKAKFSLGDAQFELVQSRRQIIKAAKQQVAAARKGVKQVNAFYKNVAISNRRAAAARAAAVSLATAPFSPVVAGAAIQNVLNQPLSGFYSNKPLPIPKFKRKQIADALAANTVDDYLAGPGSVYGIGRTLIQRRDFTENEEKNRDALISSAINAGKALLGDVREDVGFIDTTILPDYDGLIPRALGAGDKSISEHPELGRTASLDAIVAAQTSNPQYAPIFSSYTDLQAAITAVTGSPANIFTSIYNISRGTPNTNVNTLGGNVNNAVGSYSTNVLASGITYTNPYGDSFTVRPGGTSWNNISREVRVSSGRVDKINQSPLLTGDFGDDIQTATIAGAAKQNVVDLVKFKIEAINTDRPSKVIAMLFRAYITSYSDDTQSEWNEFKYAGRGENFFVYKGFSRKINVGFKVAALSSVEMEPMYQKLNFLMSNLMPDYNRVLMRGPLTALTIGNWVDSQIGKIDSLSYKVSDETPWEIAINDETLILPHVVDVNMTFTPFGTQTQKSNVIPQKSTLIPHIGQNVRGLPRFMGLGFTKFSNINS